MVKRVQILGHTTAVAQDFIGREREVTVDTTLNALRVHDGVTPGGHIIITKEAADDLYQPRGSFTFDLIQTDVIDEFTLGAGVTIDNVLIQDGLVAGVDVAAAGSALISHLANVSNPHAVTKTQVGLGNVLNVAQLEAAQNLNDLPNKGTARTNLGVAIGSNVQAFDATLAALAALDGTVGGIFVTALDTFIRRVLAGTANQITVTNGDGVAGAPTISLPIGIVLPGTGAITLPTGNTAQQAGGAGAVRYNSQLNLFEFNQNGTWQTLRFDKISFATVLASSGVMAAAATLALVLPTGYKHLQVILSKVAVATDLRDLLMRVAVDNVPTFDNAAHYSWRNQSQSVGGVVSAGSETGTSIQLNGSDQLGNAANESEYFIIDIFHPFDTDDFVSFHWRGGGRTSSTTRTEVVIGQGAYNVADDLTQIQFLLSGAGNFTCKWEIYGWN